MRMTKAKKLMQSVREAMGEDGSLNSVGELPVDGISQENDIDDSDIDADEIEVEYDQDNLAKAFSEIEDENV